MDPLENKGGEKKKKRQRHGWCSLAVLRQSHRWALGWVLARHVGWLKIPPILLDCSHQCEENWDWPSPRGSCSLVVIVGLGWVWAKLQNIFQYPKSPSAVYHTLPISPSLNPPLLFSFDSLPYQENSRDHCPNISLHIFVFSSYCFVSLSH